MANPGDKVVRLYFGGTLDLVLPPDIDLDDEEAVAEARDTLMLAALADGTFTEAVNVDDSETGIVGFCNDLASRPYSDETPAVFRAARN